MKRTRSPSPGGMGARPTRSLLPAKKLKYSDLKNQLLQAAKDAFPPIGHPAVYDHVNAVLLRFDNDDMGVVVQEDELAKTLETEYKFDVTRVLLPGKNIPGADLPEEVVSETIKKLRKQNALEENCLVILVFSGHGLIINDALEVGGMIQGSNFMGLSLTWVGAWVALFKRDCSILQILDCCYAAEATHPSVETLAAASPTERASPVLATSFTQAIYRQLRSMDHGKAFTIAELAASLIAERDTLGLTVFPVYVKRRGKGSIVVNKPVDSVKPRLAIKAKTSNPRIIISANVKEDLDARDLEDLKIYLSTKIPLCVGSLKITLEGFRKSRSTVLEFNLPPAIWLQIPTDEPAYTYVAEVVGFTSYANRSSVAVPKSPAFLGTLAPLAPRPPTGNENIKPGGPSNLK